MTKMQAIDQSTNGVLSTWSGPHIKAESWSEAQRWCDKNAGYLRVIGQLISLIPCKSYGETPDWGNRLDFLYV